MTTVLRKFQYIFLLFLLMGLALFVTKGFWYFPSKGIEVSFISQAEKPIAYQVFYTTSDKRSFNPDEKVAQTVQAGKQQVNIILPVDKILRFRLDLGQFPQKVTISDLKVAGKTVVLMDKLSGFALHQIDSSKQDGKLFQFTSNQPDPYIIYKSPVNIESKWQVKVDYYILFIIAVISLLAAHKVVKYLAQFKFKESSSRIDIVFVTVFFVLLFIPMMKISGADKSEKENRMLAKYVPFIKNGQINLKYSTNFESWYNDRFLGRENLITLMDFLKYNLSSVYANQKAIYFKKTGWMFALPFVTNIPSSGQINVINDSLKKLNDFLAKQNIKLYVLVTPKKESIYQRELLNYGYDAKKDKKAQDNIQQIIYDNPDIPIIYPYTELKKAKEKDYVFFKQSHHWTDWGAYQGYLKLLDAIRADFPDMQSVSLENYKQLSSKKIRDEWDRTFQIGWTMRLLNISAYANEIMNTDYIYYDYKHNDIIKETRGNYIKSFINPTGKYRVFLTGNSQNENLLQFLSSSVKELRYIRLNKGQNPANEEYKFMKYYKKELLDFKPDLVIVTLSLDSFPRMIEFVKE